MGSADWKSTAAASVRCTRAFAFGQFRLWEARKAATINLAAQLRGVGAVIVTGRIHSLDFLRFLPPKFYIT